MSAAVSTMSAFSSQLHGAFASLNEATAVAATLLPAGPNDPTWGDNPALTKQFVPAIIDTLLMTGFSTFFTVIFGLPLGLLLVQTSKAGLTPNRVVNQVVGGTVNIVRSLPFIIGIVALFPLTKLIVGTRLGWQATVVPLVILAIPFFARLVESNILGVDAGKIEAAQMMGASHRQIRWGVQVREALPALVQSITVLAITMVGYSAMAGVIGGGGLGQLAINYGYTRNQYDVLIVSVVTIILIVQVIQVIGDMVSRLVDHR